MQMVDAKKIGWGVSVVGLIQLILILREGGGPPEYVLAGLVIALGLWSALGK